ncbi:molecular chaperone HtpG [Pectinatus brassicae]|uniref:Chaperone protein HtpG n=1 Tax=Pectinatus brassicae TaxID=862415 RepID=A0A840UUQ6_9FIRM|nr:molecular chaperone HtpG [Pectinatus brassicae]MBB5336663.1 molecular chaperone HtpG [Pectinatus brassicae]
MPRETHEFQAETKQLLDLMIHSIYTNREIFLRELVSNASDAIDKIHFESLTNKDLLENDDSYEIFLIPDADTHTLSISDNGIGMTRDELIENIGTIAKSGTKAFLQRMMDAKKDDDAISGKELIGQFGVGFYSAFMVAEKITVITRKAGEKQAFKWESAGDGSYTIEECDKEKRGTTITLTLSADFYGDKAEENFTDTYKLEGLIKKYSDYVRYPIKMNFVIEEAPKDDEGKDIEGAEKIKRDEIRTLNSMQPLWSKNKSDIKAEEYNEFYKNLFHEWEEPMEVLHNKAEGTIEYTSLLFFPAHAPFNLYHTDYQPGLQLYSRHVFIMDNCKDLLPEYLRFVKGLVDSPDFSLNISRELLQQSRELKIIGRNLENSILKTLQRMLKNNREKYEKFWAEFGKSLKIGVYGSMYSGNDTINKLKDLLLFATSNEDKGLASLKEYIERMPESQKKIYYAAGKDRKAIDSLPQMELLREKNIEVLYLLDNVDEFAIEALREYEGKQFHSISRGDLGLDDVESQQTKKETEDIAKNNEGLIKDIKESLGEKVADVKISNRLKSSAVCLVADEQGPSFTMEQAFADANNPMFKAKRILEINPHHELFGRLQSVHEQGKDNAQFKDYCELLYTQALLIEGMLPENPAEIANKIASLMSK